VARTKAQVTFSINQLKKQLEELEKELREAEEEKVKEYSEYLRW